MVAIPTMPIPHLVVYADVDVAMVAIAYSHTHDLVQCSDTPPVLHPPVSHLPPMHTHYSHNDEHKPIHSLEQLHQSQSHTTITKPTNTQRCCNYSTHTITE
jgi:hypothetical protein